MTAARMAVRGNGQHIVSLDTAIRSMRETGADITAEHDPVPSWFSALLL
ncbi:hypothetical protein [Nonomuraea sp. NPDC049607]